MAKVLLVDDEAMLRTSLGYALGKEGFLVATASDGPEALEQVDSFRPDVILLDVMLPGIDGFEVCRSLRVRADDTPVILLTAKDQISDRVSGLELGADDYVTKPFNTRELVARLHAVLRRKQRAERAVAVDRELVARLEELVRREPLPVVRAARSASQHLRSGRLRGGPVELDVETGAVTVGGAPVALGAAEWKLLFVLLREAGRVVTRTELMETVFERSGHDGLVLLEAHVRTLREKIETDPTDPRWILAVPGIGYVYTRDDDAT